MILGIRLRSTYVIVLPGSQFLKPGDFAQNPGRDILSAMRMLRQSPNSSQH
jgi:hypothetical protein